MLPRPIEDSFFPFLFFLKTQQKQAAFFFSKMSHWSSPPPPSRHSLYSPQWPYNRPFVSLRHAWFASTKHQTGSTIIPGIETVQQQCRPFAYSAVNELKITTGLLVSRCQAHAFKDGDFWQQTRVKFHSLVMSVRQKQSWNEWCPKHIWKTQHIPLGSLTEAVFPVMNVLLENLIISWLC